MDYKDYYAILGLKKGATDKEIKQAYRRLARKNHPDVNPGNKEAENKFKEISEAYEVLSSKDKRAKYDRFGHDWARAEQGAGAGGPAGFRYETFGDFDFDLGSAAGFSDFFEMLFGPRGTAKPRGHVGCEDIESDIRITLKEAFEGARKVFSISTGHGEPPKRLEVRIPPGVAEGSRIRLAGKGAAGPTGQTGDLYLRVRIAPNPNFERKGDDLYHDVAVPFTTAALGGEIQVPTLTGKVAMTIPPGTQGTQTFRLAGQGMPRLKGTSRGDLYARVQISVPNDLTQRQRELIEELAR